MNSVAGGRQHVSGIPILSDQDFGARWVPVVAGRCDVLRTLFWAATIVHWRIPHFYLMHRALHPWRTEHDTSGSRSQSDPNGLRIEAINLWIIIDE